jgi:cyanate lyase
MPQSLSSHASRLDLTERAVLAKLQKGLSWAALAEGTGLSTVYVTAAVLGQHPLPPAAAQAVCEKLGLDAADRLLLEAVPLRGASPAEVPNDPTLYRFHEMMTIYGPTLKTLVHEMFGDGIISAINFKLDIQKTRDPADGGSRAVITLDGKFLEYKPF